VVISPLDLLLPPGCALCDSAQAPLCTSCLGGLPLLGGNVCARCAAPTDEPVGDCRDCRGRRLGFVSARSAVRYAGPGRELVHAFKHGRLRGLGVPAAAVISLVCGPPEADLITWVPADPWRLVMRGYHPPELLARELAGRWGLPVRATARAASHRAPQRGSDRRARHANVRGAFVAPAPVNAARVLLVDDVHTTGATLSECARTLRVAGAGEVHALSLARAASR
jgi:predicted amidophosphoribosyltransferase